MLGLCWYESCDMTSIGWFNNHFHYRHEFCIRAMAVLVWMCTYVWSHAEKPQVCSLTWCMAYDGLEPTVMWLCWNCIWLTNRQWANKATGKEILLIMQPNSPGLHAHCPSLNIFLATLACVLWYTFFAIEDNLMKQCGKCIYRGFQTMKMFQSISIHPGNQWISQLSEICLVSRTIC